MLTLRYGETCEKITKVRLTKINRVVAKQITDDEKLTIATLQASFTAVNIQNGIFVFSDLVKLLAQNVTSFTKRYSPTDHPRILKYLKTRSLRQVIMPNLPISRYKGEREKPNGRKPRNPINERGRIYKNQPLAWYRPDHTKRHMHPPQRVRVQKVNQKARANPHPLQVKEKARASRKIRVKE